MTKKPSKEKGKWDWHKIKQLYMTSDYVELSAFLNSLPKGEGPSYASGGTKKFITGWREEKEALLQKQSELTIKKLLQGKAKENAQALVKLITGIHKRINDDERLDATTAKDIKDLWSILRVENGLPIKISEESTKIGFEGVNDDDVKSLNELIKKTKSRNESDG